MSWLTFPNNAGEVHRNCLYAKKNNITINFFKKKKNLLSSIKHSSGLNSVDILFVPTSVCGCSCLTGGANGL